MHATVTDVGDAHPGPAASLPADPVASTPLSQAALPRTPMPRDARSPAGDRRTGGPQTGRYAPLAKMP